MGRPLLFLKVCFALIISCCGAVAAQNNDAITFTAYADAREVVQNSYFELTFTLSNAQGGNFQAPNFRDFNVLAGPSQGFSTTIINGRRSQESTITYRLQPKRTGVLTIGQASIQAKGKTYRSQPLTIRVSRGQTDSNTSQEVFLEARLRPNASSLENDTGEQLTTRYLGQQLVLDYVLYSRVDVEGLSASNDPAYDGFYAREINQYDSRVMRVIRNGQQYASRILKRIVLYPQQTGTLTIQPLSMVAGVPIENNGRQRGGFFSRRQLRRVPISSKAIDIDVRSLPQPAPADFDGLTGSYRITGQANSKVLTTDDALSYRLTFEGPGDLKRITAPDLRFPAAFELYDPKELVEEYIDLSSNIKGRKVFEYVLVPKEAGEFILAPEVVVFNTDSFNYQTVQLQPQRVTVKAGTGEKQSGLVAEAENNQGLFAPRAQPSVRGPSVPFFGTPLYWGLFSTPLLLLGGLFVYLRRQDQQPEVDPVALAQQRARQQALDRLQTAQQFREAGNARAFYGEVEGALLGYVSDKLQLPRADLTKSNVQSKLAAMGASATHNEQFLALLRTCEMALYAGMDNAASMEETYERAVEVLTGMLS
ncbi:MAG: BatD family protein [Bacteroidota bacterium]